MSANLSIVVVKIKRRPRQLVFQNQNDPTKLWRGNTRPSIQFGVCLVANVNSAMDDPEYILNNCNILKDSYLDAIQEAIMQQAIYIFNSGDYLNIPDILYYSKCTYSEDKHGKAVIL